ncbi:MAG: 50S ribosomal protein L17 [Candidatus Auribacterota bacterium]|nr:50S ribosomal protein L17 [Candidatus Auribacterota bacterium]
MQHAKKKTGKLNMKSGHRESVFANLLSDLIKNGRVKTTEVRAKQLVKLADKVMTLAKKNNLHSRRLALSRIKDKFAVAKLFSEVVKQYEQRKGGYVRVIRTTYRRGDAAPMAIAELVEFQVVENSKGKNPKKSKAEKKIKKKEEKKKADKK